MIVAPPGADPCHERVIVRVFDEVYLTIPRRPRVWRTIMTNEELERIVLSQQAEIDALERRTLRSRLSRLGSALRHRRGVFIAAASALAALTVTVVIYAATINDVPNEFTAGTPISAAAMNANFDTLVANDQALNTQLGGIVSSQWSAATGGINYAGGDVGIGTSSPGAKLDINGSTKTLSLQVGITATAGQVLTADASGNATWQDSVSADNLGNHTATQNINLGSNKLVGNGGSTGIVIDANGNVGIGSSPPAVKSRLFVDAPGALPILLEPSDWSSIKFNMYFDNATWYSKYYRNGPIAQISFDASGNLSFGCGPSGTVGQYAAPSTHLFIANGGNIGIGTGDPKTKLHVTGLPEYADNATALAAGLTAGAFYRTGDLLKVVH